MFSNLPARAALNVKQRMDRGIQSPDYIKNIAQSAVPKTAKLAFDDGKSIGVENTPKGPPIKRVEVLFGGTNMTARQSMNTSNTDYGDMIKETDHLAVFKSKDGHTLHVLVDGPGAFRDNGNVQGYGQECDMLRYGHYAHGNITGRGQGGMEQNTKMAAELLNELSEAKQIDRSTAIDIIGFSRGGVSGGNFTHDAVKYSDNVTFDGRDPVPGPSNDHNLVIHPDVKQARVQFSETNRAPFFFSPRIENVSNITVTNGGHGSRAGERFDKPLPEDPGVYIEGAEEGDFTKVHSREEAKAMLGNPDTTSSYQPVDDNFAGDILRDTDDYRHMTFMEAIGDYFEKQKK
ncbi:hypothetical protein SCOR_03435 [Sulfidibacter corallicola]|uniref:Uncharacterized protein n=1 Tax=Sulfidibacter corallicola TaxID=2818388 RepID=A0A8A4TI15_SULCO|nr:hypothetical protein [Sulfidibacter corallicola]QTD48418.1 hypothetical protein J3U87_22795 [Sulfidibacter corallicola]